MTCDSRWSQSYNTFFSDLYGGGWRYTAWIPWDGTALEPAAAITSRTTPPNNGTGHFYQELYGPYNSTTGVDAEESDFNAVDVVEVSSLHPTIVTALFQKLISIIHSEGNRV